jgi:hypothetical protein
MLFSKLFHQASGLSKLEQVYITEPLPAKACIPRQTLQIGRVRYRHCVGVNASDKGLYLVVQVPFNRAQSLLIPWNDLRQSGTTQVYWETAIRFMVGRPLVAEIALPMSMYRLMERHFIENAGNK